MHNRHCDLQGPDGGCGQEVWEGSGMEGVAMKCGRVRDGGCGQEVWEGHGWRVWPCSVIQPRHPSYTTLHDHDNDNNHTVTHDLFRFLDTYTQLMQVQLYNNAYTK